MLAVSALALRRFLRERSNLFFVLILPFLVILIVGFGTPSTIESKLAVVGGDTEIGTAVLARFESDRIISFDTEEDALRAVGDTVASIAVIFPEDISEPIRVRSRSGVGIDARTELEDAVAEQNQRLVLTRQAALIGADSAAVAAARTVVPATPVATETIGTVIWGGLPNIDAAALTQVVLFMFLSALTASAALVEDRKLGMASRKAAAPISTARLVAGETLGRFWITMFQAALIVLLSGVVFGVGWGNPFLTGAVLVSFGLIATGFGVLLGSALDSPEAANGVGIMSGLVLAAVGGAMAPVEIFPDVMQTTARFTPHFWAVEGLQSSLTSGDTGSIVKPLAILAAIATGVLVVSTWLYRRRIFASR
ncbi:MAG: ABC transporter permease [Acidimicrobiales bacterium]